MFTRLGQPMNHYTTFCSSFRKPKRFRSNSSLILYSRIETAGHLVRSDFFCKDLHKRRVLRVKKTDEIQKEHTHTSLSLSLSLYICKHGLDPDQTRMVFRIECFVNLKMRVCGRKFAKRYQLCRTKADAHDKFGFWVLIGRSCNKID